LLAESRKTIHKEYAELLFCEYQGAFIYGLLRTVRFDLNTLSRGGLYEIFLDCLPCLLKQVLEASRMSTGDTEVQEKSWRKPSAFFLITKAIPVSPEIARAMHETVKTTPATRIPTEKSRTGI
jgi:hypothetical protein